MKDYDVIVIGAGCGGVTAGALLARQGRSVLLLEQSDLVGGCASTFEKDGYRFDVGATLLELIDPLEQVFELMGTTFTDEVELHTIDPVYNVVLENGSSFSSPLSVEAAGEAIARFSAEDAASWRRFSGRFESFLDFALEGFFTRPAGTMADLARIGMMNPEFLKYASLFAKSYREVVEGYFKNGSVRQSMAYQSFYCGLPPGLAPGLFAMFPYSEHRGLFYPTGGMKEVPAAIARCGEGVGMRVELNSRVEKVLVQNGKALGVRLADGTEIMSDVVVSDVHARTLYLDMVGEENLPWLARAGIRSYPLSASAPVLYIGVDYRPPLQAHHTLLAVPMETLDDYWWNYHLEGRLPDSLSGLICCPTLSDPAMAPEGHHSLNVILAGPYALAGSDWDTEKHRLAERAIEYLSKTAIPGLDEHVRTLEICTPVDFERRLLIPEGAFLAFEMNVLALAAFRPSARSRSVKGLYLAGSSTHPGGGVPTTVASGMIAAGLVARHER